MANNTYAASTGLQELVIIYDKATDDPVGFMSADGKEILFGGPTSIVDAVARASAAAAQSTASGAATSAATANASLAAISSSVAAANTTATGAQSAAAAASTAATTAQNAASTAQSTATAAQTAAATALATANTALATVGATAPATRATFMKGINLGGLFDAPWDGANGTPFSSALKVAQRVVDAGFDHVRLPIRWTSHASSNAAAVIDPAFLTLVEQVVDFLLSFGLGVIIDAHHYRQLEGDALDRSGSLGDPNDVQAADVRPRLLNIWRQVAGRFKNRGPGLIYEPYNEPHNLLDETDSNSQSTRWSLFYPSVVAAIREQDTVRPILIGASNYNNADALAWWTKPSTGGPFILAYHNYLPVGFTHQGTGGQPAAGTVAYQPHMRQHFRAANLTAKEHAAAMGTVAHMGEMGVINTAPTLADRVAYLAMARREAELAGIGWCAWHDCQTGAGSFNLWDANQDWLPGVREALFDVGDPADIEPLPANILSIPVGQTWEQWNGTLQPTVSADGRLSWANTTVRQTVVASAAPGVPLAPGQVLQFSAHGIGNCRYILAVQKKAGTPDLSAGFVYPGQARTLTVPTWAAGDDPEKDWKLFVQVESGTTSAASMVPHVCVVAPAPAELEDPALRGLSEFQKRADRLAVSGSSTAALVPPGNWNPTNYATLVTALQSATSGQTIRIAENSVITATAQLPALPVGVNLIGGGNVRIISAWAPGVNTSVANALLPVTSPVEGTTGNQTIRGVHWIGNAYQAASAIYVRGRSGVVVEDCTFREFNVNAVTFNGRGDETDGPATTKATGNVMRHCVAVGCCTWVGSKVNPLGYASGVVQFGSQKGFLLTRNVIVAKGRGSTNNGYGVKYYRLGYSDGSRIVNNTILKDVDDGTPANFGFCIEPWNDTGLLIQNNTLEGWPDVNGASRGAYTFGVMFADNICGTGATPALASTAVVCGIELECGIGTGGAPCSDVYVLRNKFRAVMYGVYVYQKTGTGSQKFERVTIEDNEMLNTRVSEFNAAAAEGGTADWKVRRNTVRKTAGGPYLYSGVKIPHRGDNSGWVVTHNVVDGGAVGPVVQEAPDGGITSGITITDNLFFNCGNSNAPVFATAPSASTTARNSVADPLWDAADFSGMCHAYADVVGA